MSEELFPTASPTFAGTRSEALQQLKDFVPLAGRYGRDRNHVVPGHPRVSRLSPAIRHRLILESECAEAPLERYARSTVEKFTQEVYWRRYWKHWLSLRPQVWRSYLSELDELRSMPDVTTRVARCEAGKSDIVIMNHFARELIETGYLHNHARMWFAGWWVHVERLPWQLGADFFYRHLLDGDPASNTLSWRWVAGLQTPGKTYLPRRSNLEKYLDPDLLGKHAEGLERLERPTALVLAKDPRVEITRPSLESSHRTPAGRVGLWIHEEDLRPEFGPTAMLRPRAMIATGDTDTWKEFHFSKAKTDWLKRAIRDGAQRAEACFNVEAAIDTEQSMIQSIMAWATTHRLEHVVALRPEVGPLGDRVAALQENLAASGIGLILMDRPEDIVVRPLAKGGFFGFWKKMQQQLEASGTGERT
ncbi:FAD-binding domain-containing protein [Haloferula sp.]|uniref:FAD-binding domain-containing protein n=1 Tax=Haloferula sp. TaxID=2497595 RepID=UPI00329C755D